jgi:hypothetical protein
MPITLRKLTGDDAGRYFPSSRGSASLDISEYVEALRGLGAGDIAEVEPGEVTDRATKRRLTMAAKELGLTLQWSKQLMGDGSIGFRVKTAANPVTTPKRRGRPLKNAS